MMTKEKVLNALQEMPEEFSLDDLFERLILIQKIETGLRQVQEGQTITHEEIKKRAQSWHK